MDTAIFAIVTVVDLVLTGSFVTIMRQNRTGFMRCVFIPNFPFRFGNLMHCTM